MLHLLTGIIRIIHSDIFCPFSIRSGLTSEIVTDLDNSREIIYLAGKSLLLYEQNWLKEGTEALVLKKTAESSK